MVPHTAPQVKLTTRPEGIFLRIMLVKRRALLYAGGNPAAMPHRCDLLSALADYARRHPERQAAAERIAHFVQGTPHCFERSHAAGHITGSAWVLAPAGERALLTLHRKLGLWLQPGGHADGDPDTLRVALREAEEESGIRGIRPVCSAIFDVDIHRIPAHPASGAPAHLHYDIRYLLRAPHTRCSISPESVELRWVSPAELAGLTPAVDESVLRLAMQARPFTVSD